MAKGLVTSNPLYEALLCFSLDAIYTVVIVLGQSLRYSCTGMLGVMVFWMYV